MNPSRSEDSDSPRLMDLVEDAMLLQPSHETPSQPENSKGQSQNQNPAPFKHFGWTGMVGMDDVPQPNKSSSWESDDDSSTELSFEELAKSESDDFVIQRILPLDDNTANIAPNEAIEVDLKRLAESANPKAQSPRRKLVPGNNRSKPSQSSSPKPVISSPSRRTTAPVPTIQAKRQRSDPQIEESGSEKSVLQRLMCNPFPENDHDFPPEAAEMQADHRDPESEDPWQRESSSNAKDPSVSLGVALAPFDVLESQIPMTYETDWETHPPTSSGVEVQLGPSNGETLTWDPAPSPNKNHRSSRSRKDFIQTYRKTLLLIVIALILALAAAIAVFVAFFVRSNGNGGSSSHGETTTVPTVFPEANERFQKLRILLIQTTGDMNIPSSYEQKQALYWLAFDDPAQVPATYEQADDILDRFVLSLLMNSRTFPEYLTVADDEGLAWTSGADVCDWRYVACDTDLQIVSIEMVEGVGGTIPTELAYLTNLQELTMKHTKLVGSLPTDMGQLSALTRLDLRYNSLTSFIPTHLGLLTNMVYLYLDNNYFSGTIPSDLSNLHHLDKMSLSDNLLTGEVPASFVNISDAAILLDSNALSECDTNLYQC
eukprot:Nitzschia sp. Nitz4//scaffold68_size99682//95475//97277//NITZ4_004578-RA/size99682-processed-gene-0.98-mRNA-1//-1//CDS//3329556635//2715//frame0